MSWFRRKFPYRLIRLCLPIVLVAGGVGSPALVGGDAPKSPAQAVPVSKPVPETVEELRALQEQVKSVLKKVVPCTVNVQVGFAQGSGVLISKDGYVLTAGHVSGQTDQTVTITLADGRVVKGKTLGGNRAIDSGLIKIMEGTDWPFVEMGKSADLKKGQWCIATGHPGGLKKDRPPVVRLGRLHYATPTLLMTDCTLVGGDSGGPLFDLQGRVIGIHSRIGMTLTANVHVPVDSYRETWNRLVASEIWGGPFGEGAYLGAEGGAEAKDCKITKVESGSPADKAGLKVNDIVLKFNDRKIAAFKELKDQVKKKRPGEAVTVEIRRGDKTMTVKLSMGKQRG